MICTESTEKINPAKKKCIKDPGTYSFKNLWRCNNSQYTQAKNI